jgi:hypothetical protein
VAAAQRGEGWQEGLLSVKPSDRQLDHLHQLAPLLLHVALKKRPERGIVFEQTAIEQGGGRIRDGPDLRKASLHQCLLNQIHNHSPNLWPGAFVAYGAAASSASRLAVIAPLLLQTGTGRQIAHSKKKLLIEAEQLQRARHKQSAALAVRKLPSGLADQLQQTGWHALQQII